VSGHGRSHFGEKRRRRRGLERRHRRFERENEEQHSNRLPQNQGRVSADNISACITPADVRPRLDELLRDNRRPIGRYEIAGAFEG